jgi:hypothetical protein
MIKASADPEAGAMPDQALLQAMGRFNEELVEAGVMVAGEGLHASTHGARVRFQGDRRIVEHGPFELDGLIAGYWVWRVASLEVGPHVAPTLPVQPARSSYAPSSS